MGRYLDIDEVLSEDERISCKVLQETSGLGHLNSNLNASDLPLGAKVDVPVWLAQAFYEKNLVDVEIPRGYSKKVRDDILAGAASVKLREFSFFYFEVGMRVSRILRDDNLIDTLRHAFCGERYQNLAKRALSSWREDVADYAQDLTSTELEIFQKGHRAAQAIAMWRKRQATHVHKSAVLDLVSSNSSAATTNRLKRGRED